MDRAEASEVDLRRDPVGQAEAAAVEAQKARPRSPAELEPTAEELVLAYRVAVRSRALEEHFVRLVTRGEVKFSIWGPGEEVHGTAAALALSKVVELGKFGMVNHYRSASLCAMWCQLHGHEDFPRDLVRQQFSKATDRMSGGRQMVNHYCIPELGILPLQSPVGMQLGKAAGYAMGFKLRGVGDAVVVAVIGDGTTAEGDLHDAMNAASVWELPLLIMITDNNIAISTTPEEGRGVKDFRAYAAAFGLEHYDCDGRDFWDVHGATLAAARHVRERQRSALLHVRDLPRLNAHSSAADPSFDLTQDDPLLTFGHELVGRGLLEEGDILKRVKGEGRDFFAHHELGRIMEEETERVRRIIQEVREEPDPDPATIFEHVYLPFPEVEERPAGGRTAITYAGAIRAALDHIISDHGGVLWGQDVGRLGGVMQATAGLQAKHPERVIDSPLNEPLIVGTACGVGLHDGLVALPEIQFGDYALNAFHWLVHLGNLHWGANGAASSSVILRMPVDPFGGGAIYHSMSVDGYFTPIPGLVIVMPSSSYDVFGLLMTAAEYGGPVVVLEPKFAYRLALGPAFPGEPTDPDGLLELRNLVRRGGIPEIDATLRVPFSKAAVRRRGKDLTVVGWGRAAWTALEAAEELAGEGIDAEVIDLRTLVPPDFDTVFESVGRTGRLVVAAEDRPLAGFVRAVQGAVVERFQGAPTRAIGQKNVPGVGQSPVLEEATVLGKEDVLRAAREVMEARVVGAAGWLWIPPRYYQG